MSTMKSFEPKLSQWTPDVSARWSFSVLLILSIAECCFSFQPPPLYYHHYDNMTAELNLIHKRYPEFTSLYSVGRSVQGRELWVLELTADKQKIGVPYVKLVANIHGNEPLGKELLIHLAKYLLTGFAAGDKECTFVMKNTKLHLMPCMNPDGFENSYEGTCRLGPGRSNANGIDLNRNFPEEDSNWRRREEPETRAIRQWMISRPFLLSASLHGGALLANYPFDKYRHNAVSVLAGRRFTRELGEAAETDDDDVFKHLALIYSENHPDMYRGISCKPPHRHVFDKGITNGAAWYQVSGGMQDYNYLWHGCMELTLEIGCCKYPPVEHLPSAWNENLKPLLKLIEEGQRGVKGLVLDRNSGEGISHARVKVSGRNMTFYTSPRGEYWRILLPGTYFLEVSAKGYKSSHVRITIPKPQYNGHLTPLRQDIILIPLYDEERSLETTSELVSTYEVFSTNDDQTTYVGDMITSEPLLSPVQLDYFRANESILTELLMASSDQNHYLSLTMMLFTVVLIRELI